MTESASTIEFENLEQKYVELKRKYKRSIEINDKASKEIQLLNKKLQRLEQDNNYLENQIRNIEGSKEQSESDTSSLTPIRTQQEENVSLLIQSKNQQVSELLSDIEETEKENEFLRSKLNETKNELKLATNEITSISVLLKSKEQVLMEKNEELEKCSLNIELLNDKIDRFQKEKCQAEVEFNQFSVEIGKKIDEWKVILDKKNAEIEELKNNNVKIPTECPPPNGEGDCYNFEYARNLKDTLDQAEAQISQLKLEMKDCTGELTDSARIIEDLRKENKESANAMTTILEENAKLKEQLRKGQSRCRKLQTAVEYANKINGELEVQLSDMQEELRTKGHVDAANATKELQRLKVLNLLKEKKIVELVNDLNELQDSFESIQFENQALRNKFNVHDGEFLDLDKTSLRKKQQDEFKAVERLKNNAKVAKEEKINLKLEILNLNKQLANLKENVQVNVNEKTPAISADNKTLSEENEALRKGLHEILSSVQQKQEYSPREIKSEVLERLLRALDVKHISGWYHPAMRLQAELHNLEGINSELREQLREVRSEMDEFKQNQDKKTSVVERSAESNINDVAACDTIVSDILKSTDKSLEEVKINMLNIITYLCASTDNPDEKLEKEFANLKNNIFLLHKNCDKEKHLSEQLRSLNVTNEVQIKSEVDMLNEEDLKDQLVFERKKVQNLLNYNVKLENRIASLEIDMRKMCLVGAKTEETLLKKVAQSQLKLKLRKIEISSRASTNDFRDTDKTLAESLVKYRKLLRDLEDLQSEKLLELATLTTSEDDLKKENLALKEKLLNISEEFVKNSGNENYVTLNEKLVTAEEHAVSEKHRADHMTNLYDLVKEQLRKSEEKLVDFSKYGDSLMQKNVILQEQIKAVQDELISFVDINRYEELRQNFEALIKEQEKLLLENLSLKKSNATEESLLKWNAQKEQQLLDLKHQIIDLTASSEDKYLIYQLQSDLTRYKTVEREWTEKVQLLTHEIDKWKSNFNEVISRMHHAEKSYEIDNEANDKKIRLLGNIIKEQRVQYYGSVPLVLEETWAEKITVLNREKMRIFRDSRDVKKLKCDLLIQIEALKESGSQKYVHKKIHQEPKDALIRFLEGRIESQGDVITKLEHELLAAYKIVTLSDPEPSSKLKIPHLTKHVVAVESFIPSGNIPTLQLLANATCQTDQHQPDYKDEVDRLNAKIKQLEGQMTEKNEWIILKDSELGETRRRLNEERARTVTLDQKLQDLQENGRGRDLYQEEGAGDGREVQNVDLGEQVVALKAALASARENLIKRDVEILKYQNLLKTDRDKHSSAAANLHKDLTILQKAFLAEQQKCKSLEQIEALSGQKSSAVEKYIMQVHVLEKHLAELHTRQAKVEAQLHTTQQEASRWRQMAQDRLIAMEELGKDLGEKHQKELTTYKTDYEKLKDIARDERLEIEGRVRNDALKVPHSDPDVLKLFREKDDAIKDLTLKLKQLQSNVISGAGETDNQKAVLSKAESDLQRKRYSALLSKNKSLQEEIRTLREELSKRQMMACQKPGKSTKGQLQNKITLLETELDQVKSELDQQQLINDRRKVNVAENFDKWKKQKYWQENCEKYKSRLQEKDEELSKLQQTSSGYKLIIDRLEREKFTLENKIKSLKSDRTKGPYIQEMALVKIENARLHDELASLQKRIEGLQQGSGALGAALMQEKLEAQERKIAVLELSCKGNSEIRNEMERLQISISSLQKTNLCLEAENLELKMDLEKHIKETPYLQEQIQHLENYVEILKNESGLNDCVRPTEGIENKKVSQLERTVFILKRVVEKLQVENKRLTSGKNHCSERSSSADRLKRDYVRLKEQYMGSLQKINELQMQSNSPNKKRQPVQKSDNCCENLQMQLEQVKHELTHKTQLLDKVKALLHAAAAKEKQLIEEITALKSEQSGAQFHNRYPIDIPSPIEELSEESNAQ